MKPEEEKIAIGNFITWMLLVYGVIFSLMIAIMTDPTIHKSMTAPPRPRPVSSADPPQVQ